MDGRFVIEGKLGCPICSASYPIAGGVADLREFRGTAAETVDDAPMEDEEAITLRVAAMLGLTRAGSVAVLSAMPSSIARLVAELASVRVVGTNATTPSRDERENVAMVLSDNRLPFASGSIDAVMLGSIAGSDQVAEAVRVLRTGGRLVVPVGTALGGNVRELARDDRYIVAESAGPLLNLSR